MINPFLLRTADRLAHWKEFRRSLALIDEKSQLDLVAEYWSKAPLVSIAYDPFDETSWPTPWEMLRDNMWCRKTIAIGMENTLRLAGFPADRMCLEMIIDRDIQEMLMILVIDGQQVLNYDWGMVRPYPSTNLAILKSWKFVDKSYNLI